MKIALFATGMAGLEVCNFFSESQHDSVEMLCLSGKNRDIDSSMARIFSGSAEIVRGGETRNGGLLKKFLAGYEIEAIVSVYWPWVIPQQVADSVRVTVNFHPSLLPYGRGWYPHVHNLIDGSRAGVSLHELATPVDSGRIWVQRVVEVAATDVASDLYARLQSEILGLFRESWPAIRDGELTSKDQSDDGAVYFPKNAFEKTDVLNLDDTVRVGTLIDILRARTFQGKGYAHFHHGGKKISVSISLREEHGRAEA